MAIRRIAAGLAVALTMGIFAAPTQAGPKEERAKATMLLWEGKWKTEHKFGTPVLQLSVNTEKKTAAGTYKDETDEGDKIKGRISGSLVDEGRVWVGTYRDAVGGSKGKFTVVLKGGTPADDDSDVLKFEGTFSPKGKIFHGEAIPWTGTKK